MMMMILFNGRRPVPITRVLDIVASRLRWPYYWPQASSDQHARDDANAHSPSQSFSYSVRYSEYFFLDLQSSRIFLLD
jgi:hypothetical protein